MDNSKGFSGKFGPMDNQEPRKKDEESTKLSMKLLPKEIEAWNLMSHAQATNSKKYGSGLSLAEGNEEPIAHGKPGHSHQLSLANPSPSKNLSSYYGSVVSNKANQTLSPKNRVISRLAQRK